MKRYSLIPTTTRWDGKRVYKTTSYPKIVPSSTDLLIISTEGDCLDSLSYKYYGDPTLWWILAISNPGLGLGKLSVPGGTQLRVPMDVSGIIHDFNQLNK